MDDKIKEQTLDISWKKDKKYALARILMFVGIIPLFNAIRLMRQDVWELQTWISIIFGFGFVFYGAYLLEKTKTYKKTPMYKMSLTMKGKNDPKLTRNLIISEGVLFLLFAGLIATGAILQGKGIDTKIKYFDNIFLWGFVLIFSSFFFVMAYFGIRKKYFISADYLNYFLMIGIIVLIFQSGYNAVIIVGGIVGIVVLFVFGRPGKSKELKTKEDHDIYARKVGYLFLILGVIVFLFSIGLEVRAAKVFGTGLFATPCFKSLGLIEVYDPFDSKYPNMVRDDVKGETSHTYNLNGIEYQVNVGYLGKAGVHLVINGYDPNHFLIPGDTITLPDGAEVFVQKIFYDKPDYFVVFWIGNR